MDIRSTPESKRTQLAEDVDNYTSVSEYFYVNPLVVNKGNAKPFPKPHFPMITKVNTELDLTSLVISKDVIERHERFMCDIPQVSESIRPPEEHKASEVPEVNKVLKKFYESQSNYAEQSTITSSLKKIASIEEKDDDIANESYSSKEDEQYNYIINYVVNRNFKMELAKISKMVDTYKYSIDIVKKVWNLNNTYQNSLVRNLNKFEYSMPITRH